MGMTAKDILLNSDPPSPGYTWEGLEETMVLWDWSIPMIHATLELVLKRSILW